jgi:ppGpp synthetase/RelA/SpoT-type nucleotidyltranferase
VEKHLSNAQIDRLGERLRRQQYGEVELRLLDEYRRTFGSAYDHVVETIQRIAGVAVSGRPAKSTSSIVEKLNRESIRLSQMQDIAGCRAVVSDVVEQDRTVSAIAAAFHGVTVLDRRVKPSHGYRAVHLIVRESNKPIEVQVRTALQHVWAEMSEKCADTIDPSIKYGGGPQPYRGTLDEAAQLIHGIEDAESALVHAGADTTPARKLRDIREESVAILQALLKDLSESNWEA